MLRRPVIPIVARDLFPRNRDASLRPEENWHEEQVRLYVNLTDQLKVLWPRDRKPAIDSETAEKRDVSD